MHACTCQCRFRVRQDVCLTYCLMIRRLHLLAVTLDGRRVYFSTSAGGGYGFGAATTARGNPRPTTLRAEIARQAPPQPGAPTTGRVAGHGAAPPSRCLAFLLASFRLDPYRVRCAHVKTTCAPLPMGTPHQGISPYRPCGTLGGWVLQGDRCLLLHAEQLCS